MMDDLITRVQTLVKRGKMNGAEYVGNQEDGTYPAASNSASREAELQALIKLLETRIAEEAKDREVSKRRHMWCM